MRRGGARRLRDIFYTLVVLIWMLKFAKNGKVVTYETPTKKVDIPVQVVEEGVIQALGPSYKGGSGLYTTDVNKGTLGVNTTHKGQYCLLSVAHVLTHFNCANSERRLTPGVTLVRIVSQWYHC